jgi:hypothetical protein
MSARKIPNLPADLESTRRRFEQWRQMGRVRTAIPGPLWAEAVKLADQYGICRTAKALRVGYYALKERVEREAAAVAALASASPVVNKATFLELAVPAQAGAGECVLEWEDAAGGKMRVHLKGLEAPDLVALSRSFWEGRR